MMLIFFATVVVTVALGAGGLVKALCMAITAGCAAVVDTAPAFIGDVWVRAFVAGTPVAGVVA